MLEAGEITFKLAEEWLEEAIGESYEQNQKFYDGDHWQDGEGWLGQIPDGNERQALLNQIQRTFVHKNMVAELIDRHVGAVVGREPAWSIVPVELDEEAGDDAENETIALYEALLTQWWDGQRVGEEITTGLPSLLYAGRAVWRFYISPAAIEGDERVGALSRVEDEDVWRYIYLEALSRTRAAVYRDKELAQDIGIYRYTNADDKDEIEISYVDELGMTHLQVLSEQTVLGETVLDLGKRLPIFEINRAKPFISPSMIKNQMALNLGETMRTANTFKTGFNELILFNAHLNGSKQEVEGRTVFIPDPIIRGPGRLHNFVGVRGADGSMTTPSAFEAGAFDPARLIAGSDASKRNMYEEAKQLHAMISGDAVVSGEARVQATGDFEASLRPTKAKVDALLRWVLATSLDFHLLMTGRARDEGVRVDASARLSASIPNSETVRIARENATNEFWSMETALVASGIEDPDAEMQRLEREREQQVQRTPVTPGALDEGDDVPEDEPVTDANPA